MLLSIEIEEGRGYLCLFKSALTKKKKKKRKKKNMHRKSQLSLQKLAFAAETNYA
jgi:hypothetical protein